ncbi:hypothetical protein GGR56DRAFT_683716 [Xylariaceae sp. FL0804]|nr:hypothetical protein GGR56DRAFT_683716 [Xylariaceae sp. FL0804]
MSQTENEALRQLGREVANHFTHVNRDLVFQDFAGIGRHGGALIFRENERHITGGPLRSLLRRQQQQQRRHNIRRLVVKYSLGALSPDEQSAMDADAQLRNEHRWLQLLRGAEHVVQLVDLPGTALHWPAPAGAAASRSASPAAATTATGDSRRARATRRRVRDAPRRAVRRVARLLGGLAVAPGGERAAEGGEEDGEDEDEEEDEEEENDAPRRQAPTFALEYLECVLRQCAAMAFPPNLRHRGETLWDGRNQVRERVIPHRPFYGLTQNSNHLLNFMLSSPRPPHSEHGPGIPPVKIIDFGRGKVFGPSYHPSLRDQYGSRHNIMEAANASPLPPKSPPSSPSSSVMMWMCCPFNHGRDLRELRDSQSVPHESVQAGGRTHRFRTCAPRSLREHRLMSRPLRDTLCEAMAPDVRAVPSLDRLIEAAEHAVAELAPHHDAALQDLMGVQETDEYIMGIVQRLILDARRE